MDDVVEIMARQSAGAGWDDLPIRDQIWHRLNMKDILRALDAAGYAVVPVEPTPEMIVAHDEAHAAAETVFADPADVYRAMITAGNLAGKRP